MLLYSVGAAVDNVLPLILDALVDSAFKWLMKICNMACHNYIKIC